MIFNDVCLLKTTEQKKRYREKIEIYNAIVASACKYYGIEASKCEGKIYTKDLIEIGVVDTVLHLENLRELLKDELYCKFLYSVSIVHNNKDLIGALVQNLNNSDRKKLQAIEEKRNGFTMVDLFCGAGGLSLGFKQTGFKTLFANDFDPLCIETYRFNHPEIPTEKIICGDIKNIVSSLKVKIPQDIDVLLGGPPCQGFSSANQHHRVIDDPRNELYKFYLRAVSEISPKVVVMENVKGMLKVANQVIEDFSKISVEVDGRKVFYSVSYQVLNSADFSVAQSRERLIYIGFRNDVVEKTHMTPAMAFELIKKANMGKKKYVLKDALQGLKELVPPQEMNVGEIDTEINGYKIDSNIFKGNENEYLKLINNDSINPLVYNHKARYCSKINFEIYKRLTPGDDATNDKIADIMPYSNRNDKFKDKYYKLYPDRPCRTITAHMRSDCHSHIHPFQARTLTPREAARVQSFPDSYVFLGPYLLTYKQIGNAVPTVMSRGIAQVLAQILTEYKDCENC